MRKVFCYLLPLLLISSVCFSAVTITRDAVIEKKADDDTRILISKITIITDGSGGSITGATNVNVLSAVGINAQLIEVETIYGASTCAVYIKNSNGTVVWSLAALDATQNKLYGGHTTNGIFPLTDLPWYITTGTLANSDTVSIIFKYAK